MDVRTELTRSAIEMVCWARVIVVGGLGVGYSWDAGGCSELAALEGQAEMRPGKWGGK